MLTTAMGAFLASCQRDTPFYVPAPAAADDVAGRAPPVNAPDVAGAAGNVPLGANANKAPSSGLVSNIAFAELYQHLLLHAGITPDKSRRWREVREKWVRWTGELISFSRDGLTLRMNPDTGTFDVSVQLSSQAQAVARQHYKLHDQVTFVARLIGYDDVFRTLYLDQGAVVVRAP